MVTHDLDEKDQCTDREQQERNHAVEAAGASGRVGELRPWLLGAALVDGWWWLSGRMPGRPWEYRDDFGALHSDDHWQREAVLECDDSRPQREPLWEYRGRAVKRVNFAPFSRDVPILAALVLHPRRARSDREGLGQVRR